MKDKTILIKAAYLMNLTEEDYNEKYDEILLAISNIIGKDISVSNNLILEWEGISTILLEPRNTNCGRCNNCNKWVTNREQEEHIDELNNGAIVNGQLLCDECLPEDHRWAF